MRDTPLQAMEQMMTSQPGQKPRGSGTYRGPFHYRPKDVRCECCANYDGRQPCRLCECICLEERIKAGALEWDEFVRDCFAPSMRPQLRRWGHQQGRKADLRFFLSDAHRRRWTYWTERCWRLSDRNKAALFLLTAYESLWHRMIWKCGNDGFDFQTVFLRGIEPERYSVYQAAKTIATGRCGITLGDLASPKWVSDEAFQLITGALLIAKYAKGKSLELARQYYFEIVNNEMDEIMNGRGKQEAFTPAPDLREFLMTVKENGIKIGLVTSGLYEKAMPEIISAFKQLNMGNPLDFYDCIITAGQALKKGQAGTLGELVEKIIIESGNSIRFLLQNGLELRESIERTVR